ncbi:MAG TPA: SCP2 sterol-binding domain-containing protein [Solirubrobacterales bacterium]|nr:SCP2 sterol-binding domain-containing protein [Solirubrobacterales bacterium]
MSGSTPQLIANVVRRFQEEVPALAKLKLVFALELRGRGDVQIFRVELPGPKVSKAVADDARVTVSMPRSHFNELAEDGRVSHYRDAYEQGHIRVEGDNNVQKLIAQVIERHEQRGRLRKVQ